MSAFSYELCRKERDALKEEVEALKRTIHQLCLDRDANYELCQMYASKVDRLIWELKKRDAPKG